MYVYYKYEYVIITRNIKQTDGAVRVYWTQYSQTVPADEYTNFNQLKT